MALHDSDNELHALAVQISNVEANIYDVSPSIGSYEQYEESLACAMGIPYKAGTGCEVWDLFMRHKDLVRTNKNGKDVTTNGW